MSDENNHNGYYNGSIWNQKYSTILQTITVVALFISAFYVAVISPINARLADLDKDKLYIAESALIREDINRRFEIDRQSIAKLQDNQVARSEHEEHWKDEDSRIADVRGNLQDLTKQFNTIFNAGDALKTIQKQLDDLRLQVHSDDKKQP